MRRALILAVGAAMAAAAAYVLRPKEVARTAKQAAGKARGAVTTAVAGMPGAGEAPDDVTLADKVETEIFRPADAPKGAVSVNAENGAPATR